jgi:fructoselysine-6-P-deglycase FrlB-like protein
LKQDTFLKEILEQPHALRSALKHWLEESVESRLRNRMGDWRPPLVILTGMGSSLNACYPSAVLLNDHGIPAFPIESAELLHYYPMLRSGRQPVG